MSDPRLRPVVVADDDPDDLFFAARAFTKARLRHPLVTCADGHEVVTLCQRALADPAQPLPAIVFLDVKMPRMNGLDTLAWIRGQPALADVAVVMLSGSSEPSDNRRARELGADDYLVKYPSCEQLAAAVARGRSPRSGSSDPR